MEIGHSSVRIRRSLRPTQTINRKSEHYKLAEHTPTMVLATVEVTGMIRSGSRQERAGAWSPRRSANDLKTCQTQINNVGLREVAIPEFEHELIAVETSSDADITHWICCHRWS